MRRRLSLALLVLLVAVAVIVSIRYRAARNPGGETRVVVDTTCLASRIGLPCAPH